MEERIKKQKMKRNCLSIIYATITLLLCSCGSQTQQYKLQYVVFYPNHPDTVSVIVDSDFEPFITADRGANVLACGKAQMITPRIVTSTAPIKIISVQVIENTINNEANEQ